MWGLCGKLCQHIGDTHDSGHEHDNLSGASGFIGHPPNSESRCIPKPIMNSEHPSTSLGMSTTPSGTNTLESESETLTEKHPSENVGLRNQVDDVDKSVRIRRKHVRSRKSSSNTPTAVKKNKTHMNNRDLNQRRLNRHSCELCEKKFYTSTLLNRHIFSHTGVKPFECETCGKCFSRDSNLKDHRYIHTGETPYKCDICGNCYRYSRGLKAHKQRVNCKRRESNDVKRKVIIKPHKCSNCGKMFRDRNKLSAHRTVHTGKGHRFFCGVCGRGFFYNYRLVTHRKTHTAEKQQRALQALNLLNARKNRAE